jgi:hypothetical protein
MRRASLAIAMVLVMAPAAWGQPIDRQTLLRVLLATDARQVAACQLIGIVSDTSPEDLRKKILRMGGDAGLVAFDGADPDRMNAQVYRCPQIGPPAAAAPPGVATAAVPPGGVAMDPTSIHRALLGTWTGTLNNPNVPASAAPRATQVPATVRMWDEAGQLRFALSVAPDLDASGTVTHFFGDITLTGTYGPQALPITYTLRLSGPTLEGSGVGPDQVVRSLSLRKQP